MAIRKNPDWHVWATDLAYWVRQSPQVFFIIGAVLGLVIIFTIPSNQTSQPIIQQQSYAPPQYVPQQPQEVLPEETFRPCAPDYFWYTPEGACSLLKTSDYTIYPGERISFSPAHTVLLDISDGAGFVHYNKDNTDHPFSSGVHFSLQRGGFIQTSKETIVHISLYPEP